MTDLVSISELTAGLRLEGSSTAFLEGFAIEFIAAGYARLTVKGYLRSALHLGMWLKCRKRDFADFNLQDLEQFNGHSCQCPGYSGYKKQRCGKYAARVGTFVTYLHRIGVVKLPTNPKCPPVPAPLAGFSLWLRRNRGVKPRTADKYVKLVIRLLPKLGDNPSSYTASRIRRSLLQTIRPLSPSYAQSHVVALRAFLRFLIAQGRCRSDLDRAVPTVPHWRLSALPRYLEADDVEKLLDACDLTCSHGVRDRAILLFLARLGLRAGDIVHMRLQDLDWGEGTVRLRGKGPTEVRLPLPQEIGDALMEYLEQHRPDAATEQVFLCAQAPIRPLAHSSTVSAIVGLALKRAGITDSPSCGAHQLRHSAATQLLRAGASLETVSVVLRHQSIDITAHYAKVDLGLLEQIAQPWPEEAPC